LTTHHRLDCYAIWIAHAVHARKVCVSARVPALRWLDPIDSLPSQQSARERDSTLRHRTLDSGLCAAAGNVEDRPCPHRPRHGRRAYRHDSKRTATLCMPPSRSLATPLAGCSQTQSELLDAWILPRVRLLPVHTEHDRLEPPPKEDGRRIEPSVQATS